MILSDREIEAAIRRGAVVITPPPCGVNDPTPEGQKSPWASTTLDLRLHPELTLWRPRGGDGAEVTFLHPDHPEFDFEKILDRYAERRVIPEGETCSAGVACWDRIEGAETLVSRADDALYRAKREGRDRVVSAV